MSAPPAPPLSLAATAPSLDQQADMLWRLLGRCVMADGTPASETVITLTRADYDDLKGIEARLRRMSPYEDKIRRAVIGK